MKFIVDQLFKGLNDHWKFYLVIGVLGFYLGAGWISGQRAIAAMDEHIKENTDQLARIQELERKEAIQEERWKFIQDSIADMRQDLKDIKSVHPKAGR